MADTVSGVSDGSAIGRAFFRRPLVDGSATNLRRDKNKVKPFVVSLSNHEWLDHAPFDKLRANG
jgi:hypothetical protein